MYSTFLFILFIYSFISSNNTTAIVKQKNDEIGYPQVRMDAKVRPVYV